MGKMSYIIVTYNGENHIKRCIDDIRNFDKEGFVLLIDNASSDNTIKEAKKSQPSKIIELSENLGFGKANNIGLKNNLITVSNSAEHVSYFKSEATVWKDSVLNASTKFLNNIICPDYLQNTDGIDLFDIVSVYPNPNNGFVNLDFGSIEVNSVRLYTVDGRIIFKDEHINSSKYKFQIDGKLGLYFIEIAAHGRRKYFQIIKK